MGEYGLEFGMKQHPHYKMFPSRMTDKVLRTKFCQEYLTEIYKIDCSSSVLLSQGLLGIKEKDLAILCHEAVQFLPIVNLYWGIWGLVCCQELQAPEMDFAAHARDRIIMYFNLKPNMQIAH